MCAYVCVCVYTCVCVYGVYTCVFTCTGCTCTDVILILKHAQTTANLYMVTIHIVKSCGSGIGIISRNMIPQ